MNNDPANRPPPSGVPFREIVTDALRFWERGRLLYNAVLVLVVLGCFCARLPWSRSVFTVDGFLGLLVLAVLANVCYCAAYVVDVFVQLSGFRAIWRSWRPALLVLGIVFAGIITRFFIIGLMSPAFVD